MGKMLSFIFVEHLCKKSELLIIYVHIGNFCYQNAILSSKLTITLFFDKFRHFLPKLFFITSSTGVQNVRLTEKNCGRRHT
jgi:hypothetical protein